MVVNSLSFLTTGVISHIVIPEVFFPILASDGDTVFILTTIYSKLIRTRIKKPKQETGIENIPYNKLPSKSNSNVCHFRILLVSSATWQSWSRFSSVGFRVKTRTLMCTLCRSGTLQILYMPYKLQVAVFALFSGSWAEDTWVAMLSRSILPCCTFIWRHYILFPPPSAPAACAQAFLSSLTAKHSCWAISSTCCHTALCERHGYTWRVLFRNLTSILQPKQRKEYPLWAPSTS